MRDSALVALRFESELDCKIALGKVFENGRKNGRLCPLKMAVKLGTKGSKHDP